MENNENVENVNLTEELNDTSSIQIADEVVAVISGIAVSEIPGVYSMAGSFAGGVTVVVRGEKNLCNEIKVEVDAEEAKFDVNIIVEYGTRIPDIAFEIQNRVKKAVENMTGLKVTEVNVHVQGVNTQFDKETGAVDTEKE